MFRKYILVLSALFALGTMTEAYADMSGDDASGFSGSFELKYKPSLGEEEDGIGDFSYRVRTHWAGEVNNMVMWKVGLSSQIEQSFDTLGLNDIRLEQAYVSYMPLEGFKINVGKFGWRTKFSHTGVLYDDDLYAQGVVAKYHHDVFYVKAALVNLDADYTGLFQEGALLKAKVGTKHDLGDVSVAAHVGGAYDGLFKNGDGEAEANTIALAGLKVSIANVGVPVHLSGYYGTNADTFFENHTYNVGVHVGNHDDGVHNINVGVSYYNIDETSWNTKVVDTDYVASDTSGNGIAVRAQWNAWENSNLVVKYARGLGDEATNKVVGELTFNF